MLLLDGQEIWGKRTGERHGKNPAGCKSNRGLIPQSTSAHVV